MVRRYLNGRRIARHFRCLVPTCITRGRATRSHSDTRLLSVAAFALASLEYLVKTNDMESAYEPVPAWWRDDMDHIGGIAELSTLIRNIRRDEPNVFLFDAGDIFTGALSRLTDGALMFEFMITMGYDAMAIGNHEFDYGEAGQCAGKKVTGTATPRDCTVVSKARTLCSPDDSG